LTAGTASPWPRCCAPATPTPPAVLKRLIQKLRQAYPKALILFRADAGFAVSMLYRYREGQPEPRYVIGPITNHRLLAKTAPLLSRAQRQYQETWEKHRLFISFSYQAQSWTRPRRIAVKVEYARLGINQRCVVTNLRRNPQFVCDDIYVLRSGVKHRIKELPTAWVATVSWPTSSACCCTPRPTACFGCCATTSRARNWPRPRSIPCASNF
jgi:hypothetical protein